MGALSHYAEYNCAYGGGFLAQSCSGKSCNWHDDVQNPPEVEKPGRYIKSRGLEAVWQPKLTCGSRWQANLPAVLQYIKPRWIPANRHPSIPTPRSPPPRERKRWSTPQFSAVSADAKYLLESRGLKAVARESPEMPSDAGICCSNVPLGEAAEV
ncbi:hypothetical protein LX36DRAFT_673210 [Colletotrichum falcatum]|nr:hypothetical protein LX36DRAFT_673210 [Colletotrichum falcatum]